MMDKYKALLEKRNALVKTAKEFGDKLDAKKLNDEQRSKIADYKDQIETMDNSLNAIKELRAQLKEGATKTKENRDDNELDKNKFEALEKRAMADYFRGETNSKNLKEYRDAAINAGITVGNTAQNTAGNGGITVPLSVSSNIIKKLDETSPVFGLVQKMNSVTGNLRVVRETDANDDGFVGEQQAVKALSPVLASVDLTQKRVGASLQLTNQVINDAGFDVVNYGVSRLGRSLAKALERSILVGPKADEDAKFVFSPIVGNVDASNVKTLAAVTPTIDELIDVTTSLNTGYLANAVWIVSRPVFNGISKLKDDDGKHLIFESQVGNRPGFNLLGYPIYVSDALNAGTTGIVFGDFQDGYDLMIKKGLTIQHVTGDTTQALSGGHLMVLDAYMDGAVVDPFAFATRTVGASNGK